MQPSLGLAEYTTAFPFKNKSIQRLEYMCSQLFRGLCFVKQGVVLLCCASLFKGILGAVSEIVAKQNHYSKHH